MMRFLGCLLFIVLGLPAEEPWSISRKQPVTQEVYQNKKSTTELQGPGLPGVSAIFFQFYQQYISDLDGATCYYRMTCSHYTAVAIDRFGAFKGSIMGADRLIRCHTGQTDSRFDYPHDF